MTSTPVVHAAPLPVSGRPVMRARLFIMKPGWPLRWLLVGFPVYWALGLASFAVTLMAVPMAWELLRRRPIVLPKGFGFWALFLIWSVAGLLVLGVNPAGTVPGSAPSRLIAFGFREASYVAVTIVMLYIGNLRRSEVRQQTVVHWLGILFISTVAGGVLGLLWPNFSFTSPLEMVLPGSIRRNNYVYHLVHPALAQVQDLLGDATPRPAAPFLYTNAWGFHLTLLAIWFAVGWVIRSSPRRRAVSIVVLAAGAITLIFSLNRAAWIGVGVAVIFIAIQLALRGKLVPLVATALVCAVAVGAVYGSPLRGVVQARLENGKSNDIRAFTTTRALELSQQSPILGFGNTRQANGSASSIAVGRSAQCPTCGNASIGMNGYLYMLLITTGYVGAGLFFLFGAIQVWRARLLHSPTGIAGCAVLVLTTFYAPFYDVATWMMVPFVTIGILWRERDQAMTRTDPETTTAGDVR